MPYDVLFQGWETSEYLLSQFLNLFFCKKFSTILILKLISLFLWLVIQLKVGFMKYSEVERKLKTLGCYHVRDGKKHPIWFSPVTNKEFDLSHHRSEEVKPGTLKSISKDSGVKL